MIAVIIITGILLLWGGVRVSLFDQIYDRLHKEWV